MRSSHLSANLHNYFTSCLMLMSHIFYNTMRNSHIRNLTDDLQSLKWEFPSLTRRRRPALSTGRELNRLMIGNDVSKSSTFSQAEWKITALCCTIWRHLRTRDAHTSHLIVKATRFHINVTFWSANQCIKSHMLML